MTPEPCTGGPKASLPVGPTSKLATEVPHRSGTCELGIYLHIPFCVRKCPYCDFVTGPAGEPEREAYIAALISEIRGNPSRGASARTVYFGGGTPSELGPEQLESVLRAVEEVFRVQASAERTIECNPGTVDLSKLRRLRAAGFNRISLGVQSFKDTLLSFLGRIHDATEARQAIGWIREAGFDNLTADLIFGIPGQSLTDWREDLEELLGLRPDHLSLYCLTIEPQTEFGRLKQLGRLSEIDEDLVAEMFEMAMDLTADAGYSQYEISNYALPGRESRHNLVYWRNEPYLGFGISAASYLDGRRWTNTANRADYVEQVRRGSVVRCGEERLEPRRALGEEIMLRLRLSEGFSITGVSERWGIDAGEVYEQALRELERDGLVDRDRDTVRLTRHGKLVASSVCAQFL